MEADSIDRSGSAPGSPGRQSPPLGVSVIVPAGLGGDVMKTWPCADFSVIRDLLRILSWCKPVFARIEPILPTSLGTSPRRP